MRISGRCSILLGCYALTLFMDGCASGLRSGAGPLVPGVPFERHALGDTRYYLAPSSAGPKPLVVVVQGSGCGPVFTPRDDNSGLMRATAGQDLVQRQAGRSFAVLIVEKPGVASEAPDPGDPGSSVACSEAFRRSHSLDRWSAVISAAIDDAKRDPRVDAAAPVRLIGLSEGAVTVARIARDRRDVSHVAFISGVGCDQWGDMLVVARRDAIAQHQDPTAAVAHMEEGLRRIARDPTNADALFEEQTNLYWSTFGRACPAEDLAKSDADVFVAFGTADEQIDASGVEAIVAARIGAKKPVTVRRFIDGSHVLNTPGTKPFDNLIATLNEAVEWMKPPLAQSSIR